MSRQKRACTVVSDPLRSCCRGVSPREATIRGGGRYSLIVAAVCRVCGVCEAYEAYQSKQNPSSVHPGRLEVGRAVAGQDGRGGRQG